MLKKNMGYESGLVVSKMPNVTMLASHSPILNERETIISVFMYFKKYSPICEAKHYIKKIKSLQKGNTSK